MFLYMLGHIFYIGFLVHFSHTSMARIETDTCDET